MITWKKAGTALLIASLLASSTAPAAMAASRKKVGKIYLTIDSDIRRGREGGDIEVTPTDDNTDLYYVDSWEITNETADYWTTSRPPEIDIILGVQDDEEYYFANTKSSDFKLTLGDFSKNRFYKVKYLDSRRSDRNGTLILTIQLLFDKDADTSSTTAPSNLKWSDTGTGTGLWNQVSSAKYYQVQLIKDDSPVGSIYDIYDCSYNFAPQITSPGTYKFKVRSVKSSNNSQSGWATSRPWTLDQAAVNALSSTGTANAPSAGSGEWVKSEDGRWWWDNGDGTFPSLTWKDIDGQWYYFDADGYMATGWIDVEGKSYYLDPDTGVMYANQRTPDNQWADSTGALVPGM